MDYSNLTMLTEVQFNRPQLACYDVAIVGAGVSSAYTMIQYIALLEQQAGLPEAALAEHRPVKIVVIEKSGEFWTGIPYGSRSGRNALLISPLHEFIPQPAERQDFCNWLTANRDRVFNPQEYNRGELSRKWLEDNSADIAQGRWDNLFIPRHTFGLYLKERLELLIETTTATGLIEFKGITADVLDIQHSQEIYQIDLDSKNNSTFLAKKVVLAIGSPPNVAFEHPQSEDRVCYIDNMYEPSLDSNIDLICQSLAKSDLQSQRQVLVVGSNAGTLDTLYSINNSKLATSLIDKFVIVSPNAVFPHRISREIVEVNYTPQHLLDLVKSTSFTAKQILAAVQADVAGATAQNINISDIFKQITDVVMQGLNRLDYDEKKQFVIKYAVEIGKLQRRAGGEYLDVIENLIAQNKLELIKGKFVGSSPLEAGGSSCEYIDSEDLAQKVLDAPISVIINCAGFQDVTKSDSPLIQNLIRREICVPNDSNRGFTIDKNFESIASKNCYLMGPLVAGNIDGEFKIWHAESCQRIIGLSATLAKTLIESKPVKLSALMPVTEDANAELLLAAA